MSDLTTAWKLGTIGICDSVWSIYILPGSVAPVTVDFSRKWLIVPDGLDRVALIFQLLDAGRQIGCLALAESPNLLRRVADEADGGDETKGD